MCNHKNNEVQKFSDFVKVTGINWKQVFGHLFAHNSTVVFLWKLDWNTHLLS